MYVEFRAGYTRTTTPYKHLLPPNPLAVLIRMSETFATPT